MVTQSLLSDSKLTTVRYAQNIAPLKITPHPLTSPTHSHYYTVFIKSSDKIQHIESFNFLYFRLVLFEDVLNYVTKYLLTCFTIYRNRHGIASVSSQFQNCKCT